MQEGTRVRPALVPGIVALAGGAVLVIGSLMAWVKVDLGRLAQLANGGLNVSVKGTDADGIFSLIFGIIVAVAAIVLIATGGRRLRRALGVVMIVFGLLGAVIALIDIGRKDSQVDKGFRQAIQAQTGHPATDAELNTFKALLERFGVTISLGVGIYVTAVGGLIALVGGAMAFASRAPATVSEPSATGAWDQTAAVPPIPAPPPVPPETAPPQAATATMVEPVPPSPEGEVAPADEPREPGA